MMPMGKILQQFIGKIAGLFLLAFFPMNSLQEMSRGMTAWHQRCAKRHLQPPKADSPNGLDELAPQHRIIPHAV
jgi:hypothetical protein